MLAAELEHLEHHDLVKCLRSDIVVVDDNLNGHVALGLVIVRVQHVAKRAVAKLAEQLEAVGNVVVLEALVEARVGVVAVIGAMRFWIGALCVTVEEVDMIKMLCLGQLDCCQVARVSVQLLFRQALC